ncbi:SMI1/KNR4 family protein [Calothrix sp. CCY 0018]|uniref:SMI1/KNR4 family protein n=1 Tax=Calothrix sp. CCY 0018 TaxID=3103864 RepID=UPI0039C71322
MNIEQWQQFLKHYSIELLDEYSNIEVDEEVYQNQWMGYEAATETQIVEAEKRLGISLPNSLRNFYLVTNGWRETGCFIYDILPVEEIDWLRIRDSDLYGIACELEEIQATSNEHRYQQGTQVKRSLAISSWEDAAIWLLDPAEQNAQGEWAGGRWASWNPAMKWTATSFAELMKLELEDFIRLRDGEQ